VSNRDALFYNAGPANPKDHYCLSPFERLNQNELVAPSQRKKYFILHAPLQTDKTSALLAFMEALTS
jgi:hypothetical protein